MKLSGPLLSNLRRQLARQCPEETLRIAGVELFFGPSPHCASPAIICHLEATGSFPVPESRIELMASLLSGEGQEPLDLQSAADAGVQGIVGWAGGMAASSMQHHIGSAVGGGARSSSGDERYVSLWIGVLDEAVAISSLRLALSAAVVLLAGSSEGVSALQAERATLRRLCAPLRPSPETQAMIAAAGAGNVPVLSVSASPSIRQFGWGTRSELFWVTSSNRDGMVGARISRLKHYQKKLFENLGLPTPRWRMLPPDGDLADALRSIGFPCVVKPADQGSGRGVTANISNMEMLNAAVRLARSHSPLTLIEAHQAGQDHRLMVVNGRLEMALRLDPPVVRGDGRRTVAELVSDLNRQRAEDRRPGAASQVPADESLDLALMGQQLTPACVPEAGRDILLRTNANRATGGTAVNVLADVHPDVRRYAELLAEAAGLRTAGIDYITPDIGKSHMEVGGGFLEINATPGMARAIAAGLVPPELTRLVLGSRPGRIPVSLLIARTKRLDEAVEELATQLPESTAVVSSCRALLGSTSLPSGSLRPIDQVNALLRYRSVACLQILWTPEEIVRWGFPVDSLDCAVLLEASLDPEWLDVVRRCAREVVAVPSTAEAVRVLRRQTGET